MLCRLQLCSADCIYDLQIAVIFCRLQSCSADYNYFLQITLLESELEDVLVNSVNALRVLGAHNKENQSEIAETGALVPLVEFLSVHDSGVVFLTASI